MLVYHPQPDEHGNPLRLKKPSKPTPLSHWANPNAIATVTPGDEMPAELNGISLADWLEVPASPVAWGAVEGQLNFEEPPFHLPQGKSPAAGVVIMEPDGRIWLVSPSNGYAGYQTTFPKGRVESGETMQANAIREAYEETGLKVKITGIFIDSTRSLSHTRYYSAQRVGGNPASMGWETQAVHLVPRLSLSGFLTHSNDHSLLKLLLTLNL
jgi:8-oxo-dGTP pyrophosphatase MutT (NUDIX family)